jgi:hypothetical protein
MRDVEEQKSIGSGEKADRRELIAESFIYV